MESDDGSGFTYQYLWKEFFAEKDAVGACRHTCFLMPPRCPEFTGMRKAQFVATSTACIPTAFCLFIELCSNYAMAE